MTGSLWRWAVYDADGRIRVDGWWRCWRGAGARAVADERMAEFLARAELAWRAGDGPAIASYAGWWLRMWRDDDPGEFAESTADEFLRSAEKSARSFRRSARFER